MWFKSVGVIGGPQSANAKILQALMRRAGANPDKVDWITMQTGGPMVAAISTHQVDVVYGDSSTALAAESQGAKRLFDFSKDADPLNGLVYSTFVSSKALLAKMPDLSTRFNAAIRDAYKFMADPANSAEVTRIATDVVGLPKSPTLPDAIADRCRPVRRRQPRTGQQKCPVPIQLGNRTRHSPAHRG